jgi:hypothetical protein
LPLPGFAFAICHSLPLLPSLPFAGFARQGRGPQLFAGPCQYPVYFQLPAPGQMPNGVFTGDLGSVFCQVPSRTSRRFTRGRKACGLRASSAVQLGVGCCWAVN